MRPYKYRGAGGGTARRGRPLVRQGGPVLLSFLFVGNAGTAPPFSSDPHPAGRLSAARGRMLCAPTNDGGTGGVTAHRYRTLIRQGGPVLFSFPFVGNAGTGPAFPTDPHPVGAAISRPRAHAMRPYKRGAGTGGVTAHRYRPFPFRKIRRTTFPNAVRRLIQLPRRCTALDIFKSPPCRRAFEKRKGGTLGASLLLL